MDWRKYQEATAELFRSLGCSAEVDKVVQGARAEHKIDVWVTFSKFGFLNRWTIECKYWNSNVTKEKVMVLRSIVDDVGADHGVIISKTGFQSGAIRATAYSNITLTSLEDLKQTAQDDLIQSSLYHLESRATLLRHELRNLYRVEQTGPNGLVSTPLPGVDWKLAMRATGKLSILEQGFDSIRLAKPPYPVTFDDEGENIIAAPTIDGFVETASLLLQDVQNFLDVQIKNAGKASKELPNEAIQPTRYTRG